MAVKQTAGREALGEFAPKFAELNLLLKRKHSLIAIADKIVRCIRHRVFFIKKFCNMKAADIHIKMNVALIKVRRTGFPYFRVRIPEPKLPSEAVVMFDQAL